MIRDEYRSLDSLKPNARNYNRHSERQVQKQADRIRVNGYTAPCIITADGTLLGGHLRRLGLLKLRAESYPEPDGIGPGWQVPCRVVEGATDVRALAILAGDNPDPEGLDFDQTALADLLAELQQADALEGSGYDDARLDELIAAVAGEPAPSAASGGAGIDPNAEWEGMPEYIHEDQTPFRTLHVHFADEAAAQEFSQLIGQEFSDEAKYIWHPREQRADLDSMRYAGEP